MRLLLVLFEMLLVEMKSRSSIPTQKKLLMLLILMDMRRHHTRKLAL